MESATRLESRSRELERGMGLLDREEKDRRILDGDALVERIRVRALSAESGTLTDYGKYTQ